jgi:hypothetical protein
MLLALRVLLDLVVEQHYQFKKLLEVVALLTLMLTMLV